jgi:hypothetical protein
MGIEYRRGRPYFYRKARRGGRVVSEYAGGEIAECLAMLAEADRVARQGDAERSRAELRRLEDEERAFAADFDRVETQARAMLESAGYHRPKGRWRKRHGQAEESARPE